MGTVLVTVRATLDLVEFPPATRPPRPLHKGAQSKPFVLSIAAEK